MALVVLVLAGCEAPTEDEAPPADEEAPPAEEVPAAEVEVGPEGPAQIDDGGITEIPDDPELIEEGEALFRANGCSACHAVEVDQIVVTGPSLVGVTERRQPEWIARMILAPGEMLDLDPTAQEMLAEYMVIMPDQNLSVEEVRAIMAYLGTLLEP